MSRIDGYSYTKRFLPFNESESDFRIFEKKLSNSPQKEKIKCFIAQKFSVRSENWISCEESPRSVIERLCTPQQTHVIRYLLRHATVDAKANFRVLNSNQEVAK